MLYSIRAIRGGEIELHEAWRCYRSHHEDYEKSL